jgi:hypothetical protein
MQSFVAHFRLGSFSTKLGHPRHVWFTPDSDRIADIAVGPFRANSGSQPPHSIASSATSMRDWLAP